MPVEDDRTRDRAGRRETDDAPSEVRETLAHLVKDAGARCALLLTRDGRVLAEAGMCVRELRDEVRSGTAAAFDVARLARQVLGRKGVHGFVADAHLEVTLVDDTVLLGTVYERAWSLFDVRACALRTASALAGGYFFDRK